MALASRLADDEVKLIDGVSLDAPKTSVVSKMLASLGLGDQTVLLSPEKHDGVLWKSARNIAGMSVSPVAELNAWSILRPRTVVMTTGAIDAFRASVQTAKPTRGGKEHK